MEPGKLPGSSGTRTLGDNLSDLRAQVAANQMVNIATCATKLSSFRRWTSGTTFSNVSMSNVWLASLQWNTAFQCPMCGWYLCSETLRLAPSIIKVYFLPFLWKLKLNGIIQASLSSLRRNQVAICGPVAGKHTHSRFLVRSLHHLGEGKWVLVAKIKQIWFGFTFSVL